MDAIQIDDGINRIQCNAPVVPPVIS
jgi:hypothetical protein